MLRLGAARGWSAQIYRALCAVEDWVLVLILGILTASMFVIVFFRFVLNDPVLWGDIFPRLLMIWLTFLGAARAVRTSEHIVVDYFVNRAAGGRYLRFLVDLLVVLFLAFLLWVGIKYTVYSWSQNAAPLDLPYSIFTAALPAFATIALIHKVYAMATRPLGDNTREGVNTRNIGTF